MSMWKYIIRRLLMAVPVLFGVLIVTFFLTKLMPGDPILRLLGAHGSAEMYNLLSARYGFDRDIFTQFFIYLKNLFSGDWGQTLVVARGSDVWDIIMPRLPRTIELAIFATIFSSSIGILSGVVSATNRNKAKDTVIRSFSLAGVAMPVFWLGLMLQLLFGYILKIFPVTGYKTIWLPEPPSVTSFPILDSLLVGRFDLFWDRIKHIVLPGITLGLISLASITRLTRSSMLEVSEQDYIRTARAKGCTEKTVIYKHALRNSMIPTSTVIGMNFAGLIGGAVMTESVFNYKGIGQLMISAISDQEYFMLNALVFLVTLIFIVANIVTDVLYGVLDPRIRLK